MPSRRLPESTRKVTAAAARQPSLSTKKPAAAARQSTPESGPRLYLPPVTELKAQERMAVELPLSGDYVIAGPKGSGKTCTAVYRALKISESIRTDVTIITSTRPQMTSIRNALKGRPEFNGIEVTNREAWLKEFYRGVLKKKMPELLDYDGNSQGLDWDQVVRDSYAGVDSHSYVILDEAQDFHPGLLKTIGMAACFVTCFMEEVPGKTDISTACTDLLVEKPLIFKALFAKPDDNKPSETGNAVPPVQITVDEGIVRSLKEILSKGITDKKRQKGLISDYLYYDPLFKNIFRAMAEDDMISDICGLTSWDMAAVTRLTMRLSQNRGIDRRLSSEAVMSLIKARGIRSSS